MDINNIKLRLERICTALNSRFDDDYNKHAKVKFIGNGGVSVTLPGKDDKNTIDYNILSILHQLATPKDHLKKCLQKNGHDQQIVEDAINSSIHLQVLIDLDNAEKHTYPAKSDRSKKKPTIKNARQVVRNNNAGNPIIMTIAATGKLDTVYGTPPSIVLTADIFDDKDNFLFSFDTLVEKCYAQWESLAKKYNCI